MKTILSIPLIVLILFSGVAVSFATHYCEGNVVATKVSLTGELATCGMEQKSTDNPSIDKFSEDCCDNSASVYSICNNYLPSSFNVEDTALQAVPAYFLPLANLFSPDILSNTSNATRPPGSYTPNSVTLPDLCIFRI